MYGSTSNCFHFKKRIVIFHELNHKCLLHIPSPIVKTVYTLFKLWIVLSLQKFQCAFVFKCNCIVVHGNARISVRYPYDLQPLFAFLQFEIQIFISLLYQYKNRNIIDLVRKVMSIVKVLIKTSTKVRLVVRIVSNLDTIQAKALRSH